MRVKETGGEEGALGNADTGGGGEGGDEQVGFPICGCVHIYTPVSFSFVGWSFGCIYRWSRFYFIFFALRVYP